MRTLETERLLIRPFVLGDAAEFKRLLDEAFGADGSHDETRLLLDYNVIADRAHEALHQPPYEDRAIVLREGGTLVGSVGLAPCLAPFGRLPSFGGAAHRTPEVGLFWALFPAHSGNMLTLWEVSVELSRRLIGIFVRHDGRRPVFGGIQRFRHRCQQCRDKRRGH